MSRRAEPSPYDTKLLRSGETALLVKGQLTYPFVGQLRRQLQSLIEGGAVSLVVDMSGVESIDSSGVGALVVGLKAARAQSGDLRLVGVSSPVVSVLEMMNLDKVLLCDGAAESSLPLQRRA